MRFKLLMFSFIFLVNNSFCQTLKVSMEGSSVSTYTEENIFKGGYKGALSLSKTKNSGFDLYMLMLSVNNIEFCSSLEYGEIALTFADGKTLFLPQVSNSECSDPYFAAFALTSKRNIMEGRPNFINNDQIVRLERFRLIGLVKITIIGSRKNQTILIDKQYQGILSKYVNKIKDY